MRGKGVGDMEKGVMCGRGAAYDQKNKWIMQQRGRRAKRKIGRARVCVGGVQRPGDCAWEGGRSAQLEFRPRGGAGVSRGRLLRTTRWGKFAATSGLRGKELRERGIAGDMRQGGCTTRKGGARQRDRTRVGGGGARQGGHARK